MDASPQLTALADPTRRSIFEKLTRLESSVGALSDKLPVSRPAVSQHLKVLADAGLVTSRREGARRIYSASRLGLSELGKWLDAIWDDALDSFEAAAGKEKTMTESTTGLAPVIKTRTVPISVEEAFTLFTEKLDTWWPLNGFSIGHDIEGAAPTSVRFEGRVGGRVVEIGQDGQERPWADVIAWQPPNRFVLAWHPALEPVAASIVEVRFKDLGSSTEVYLEHRGWEEFGAEGSQIRSQYDPGWEVVLAPFIAAASASAHDDPS